MNESTDLINGKIWKAILWFSIPMLVGNLFQQLYNTVDSYVVGNFVSSGALAAVGQSTPIINTLVGFFTGLATGAGVVIAQYFGGNRLNKMKKAIHTSIALTLILCVLFTILGIGLSKQILILLIQSWLLLLYIYVFILVAFLLYVFIIWDLVYYVL